mmetsp:Transcript_104614/g.234893  ORF Transcript_104614/g.234893 Transcript_104614/m.234893 type:complete len:346 (+) Transcript_104614:102-1139(+)
MLCKASGPTCLVWDRSVVALAVAVAAVAGHLRHVLGRLGLVTHVPHAHLENLAVGLVRDTPAVLLALVPESLKAAAILPSEDAEALLLVISVLTAERTAIGPRVLAATVDHGVAPHALELPAVLADVVPVPVDRVGIPLPAVLRAVGPQVHTVSLLLAPHELAVVLGSTFPDLHAMAMLVVLHPLAAIGRQTTLVVVGAKTLGCVVLPLPDENVAVGMRELPQALREALVPRAAEASAVSPDLLAHAVPRVALPLAKVGGTSLEGVERAGAIVPVPAAELLQLLELPREVTFAATLFIAWLLSVLPKREGHRRRGLHALAVDLVLAPWLVLWDHVRPGPLLRVAA